MGSKIDPFITITEAAKILGRTPNEVISLCDEGLIRRKSTGKTITVHREDVKEVYESNLNSMARPRDLVKKVLLLEREVRALREIVDLIGSVNGMLTSSLDELDIQRLTELRNVAIEFNSKDSWSLDKILKFSEVFLRISDSDILRLNDATGIHDSWRAFYDLCLNMSLFTRKGILPEGRELDTARTLLHKGLRNLRSIGVLFIENSSFLKTSRELLESTMSHDVAEFDILAKQLKSADKYLKFPQNN